MTCIVGIKTDEAVYIGGDSIGSTGTYMSSRADEKVFYIGRRFLIGFTTSFRMGQLLQFSLKVPYQKKTQDNYQFMCTTFVNAVMRCLTGGKFCKPGEKGGTFLVAYRGELYTIQGDYQVAKGIDAYDAVGAGKYLALGSLYTTEELDMPPEKRILTALEASAKFTKSVGPPFHVYGLPIKKK